jgi:hypothetical protein
MLSSYVKLIRENYHARDHNHNHYANNSLGFGFIHYAMIRNIRPDRVLVLGSQRGFVPGICALACMHEENGHVDFVDAGYDIYEPHAWGGVGLWKTATPKYWKPLGVEDYITLYNQKIEDFELKGTYGYIYIDGDHTYEGVKSNYELLYPYLSEGGLMVFHDIAVDKETQYGQCGVKKFWEELKAEHKISLPFSAGLGIIQKCSN